MEKIQASPSSNRENDHAWIQGLPLLGIAIWQWRYCWIHCNSFILSSNGPDQIVALHKKAINNNNKSDIGTFKAIGICICGKGTSWWEQSKSKDLSTSNSRSKWQDWPTWKTNSTTICCTIQLQSPATVKALTDKINCLESGSGGKGSKGEKGGRQYTEH